MTGMQSLKSLDRTVMYCGRSALAMDCVLACAEKAPWAAGQLAR